MLKQKAKGSLIAVWDWAVGNNQLRERDFPPVSPQATLEIGAATAISGLIGLCLNAPWEVAVALPVAFAAFATGYERHAAVTWVQRYDSCVAAIAQRKAAAADIG